MDALTREVIVSCFRCQGKLQEGKSSYGGPPPRQRRPLFTRSQLTLDRHQLLRRHRSRQQQCPAETENIPEELEEDIQTAANVPQETEEHSHAHQDTRARRRNEALRRAWIAFSWGTGAGRRLPPRPSVGQAHNRLVAGSAARPGALGEEVKETA